MKKFFMVLVAVILMFTASFSVKVGALSQDYDGYIYMTVEKITLNQGLVQEPVKVGYNKVNSLAEIMESVLGEKSTYSGDMSNYYLEGIIDGGEPDGWSKEQIPDDIQKALDYTIGERNKADTLSGYDYSFYGGWQFTVDNHTTNAGAGQLYVGSDSSDGMCFENGSVVRLQYSLYGYGEDIGVSWGFCPFETTNTFADRGELIKKIADINAEKTEENYGKAYEYCNNLLCCWNLTKSQIDSGLKSLEQAENHKDHIYNYTSYGDGTHKAVCNKGTEEFDEACMFDNDSCIYCNTKRISGVYGDVNGDNKVNIQDVTLIQKYLAKIITLSENQLYFASFNKHPLNIATGTKIHKWINRDLIETNIGTKGYIYE